MPGDCRVGCLHKVCILQVLFEQFNVYLITYSFQYKNSRNINLFSENFVRSIKPIFLKIKSFFFKLIRTCPSY